MFHLVKKDILIIKKYVFPMMVIAIAIPLFLAWNTPEFAPFLGFVLSAAFTELLTCQYICGKEHQYSKASALLCTTPYPRNSLVASKYILFGFVYIYCCGVYWLESMFIPQLGTFNVELVLIVFVMTSIIYGIYMPVQYKFGYDKTKILFTVVFVATPFLLSRLTSFNDSIISLSLIHI